MEDLNRWKPHLSFTLSSPDSSRMPRCTHKWRKGLVRLVSFTAPGSEPLKRDARCVSQGLLASSHSTQGRTLSTTNSETLAVWVSTKILPFSSE